MSANAGSGYALRAFETVFPSLLRGGHHPSGHRIHHKNSMIYV